MFAAIGRFADRYRLYLLAGWIALAVIITLIAPNLDDVTSNDQSDFLPDDAASFKAAQLVEEYFPWLKQGPTAVLVFDAGAGQQISAPENMAFIAQISDWLAGPDKPELVEAVLSPTLNPEAAGRLIAQDGQIGMVTISVGSENHDEQSALLDEIGERLDTAPASLSVYRTGEVAISREYNETLAQSVDRTIFVTLALLILTLLMIYRSPVSPLIPLFVVTVAFMIARGLVAWLAQSVFTVSDTATMLLIVVMYGAGTDYCLFLISRFREEMAVQDDSRGAVRRTVHHVGESISSSAGTVITGFVAMAFARLGLFNTTGPTLAVGVIVSLLAGLTLTPALLGLLGQRAFWPGRAQHRDSGALYKRTSQWVSTRPLLTILVIVVAMSPLAYYGSRLEITYDWLADMPDDAESIAGFRLLEDHIGAGEMQPLTAAALFDGGDLVAETEALTHRLEAVDGVAVVRSASQPLGMVIPDAANDPQLAALSESFLNRDANAARFEVVLDHSPYSQPALDTVDEIQDILGSTGRESALEGSTAVGADIRHYLQIDSRTTIALVLAGIFIILVVMLRSVVAPLYLIGTILLSYRTTLGITRFASSVLWDTDQLTWWVPFFMFVFLVALG
ncbi:MAG: MMPL family transporter, partial [Chloroflexi bacterium]|nr:MMPL family transporter [Chloroflexota bacterium]